MTHRYFVETAISGDRATLTGRESHHLLHVMRVGPGEEVVLFDGSGAEFVARVEAIGRTTVELRVLSRSVVDRELGIDITLGVALPKGDRQRWLIEKGVELGVRRVVPIETDRGVAQPSMATVGRLRRTVVEASKQCGRNRLMEISAPLHWNAFIVAPYGNGADSSVGDCFVAHSGGTLSCAAQLAKGDLGRVVHLAVGPEGGFTREEITLARERGWQTVDLGPRILRVETAALALAALVALRS